MWGDVFLLLRITNVFEIVFSSFEKFLKEPDSVLVAGRFRKIKSV